MESASWFDASLAWFPGTVWGVLIGIFGGVCGVFCACFRRPAFMAEALIYGYWILLIGSAGFLMMGMIALISGQPYGVWYGLSLPGVIGLLVLGCNIYILKTLRTIVRRSEPGTGGNAF